MSDSRKAQPKKPCSSALLRLAAACVLFLLCLGAKVCFPAESMPYRQRLSSLLSSSTDFRSAFAQLGEHLEHKEEIAEAVGDWCVTVFAPEALTAEPADTPQTDSAGDDTSS